jgi:hypothetical protein
MSDPPFVVFQADTIEAMRKAFEEVCGTLQLTKKGDQPRALVASRIFELRQGRRA